MKKVLIAVLSLLIIVISLSGCGYKPEAEYYFEIGDVYRVIELENDEPEHKEKFGLEAYNYILFSENEKNDSKLKLTINSFYITNDILFDNIAALNRGGVEVVYNYLGIRPNKLKNDLTACFKTGFYSYCGKTAASVTIDVEKDTIDFNADKLFGQIADVDIYTFKYTDLSVIDGSEMDNGSFKIIIVTGNYYVGYFSKDDNLGVKLV